MVVKPFDITLIILVSILIVLYAYVTIPKAKNNTFVKVEVEGDTYIYDIEKNIKVEIEGPLGKSVVKIENSRVAIIDSPCRNKTCIKLGFIKHSNQSTACLPNNILVTVEGESNEVDTISY